MSRFRMVTEDPSYDEDGTLMDEDGNICDEDYEDPTDFITELERYNPFDTVNS